MQLNCFFRSLSCTSGTTRKWMRVMRLTAMILLGTALHVAAKTTGQTVNFSGQDVPLNKVFQAIEQQTGYVVFYCRLPINSLRLKV